MTIKSGIILSLHPPFPLAITNSAGADRASRRQVLTVRFVVRCRISRFGRYNAEVSNIVFTVKNDNL